MTTSKEGGSMADTAQSNYDIETKDGLPIEKDTLGISSIEFTNSDTTSATAKPSFNRKSGLVDSRKDLAWACVASDGSNGKSATSAIKPKGYKRNDLSELTINKLHLSKLGVHGRERERILLNSAFENVLTGSVERELVVISGHSGTGKTKLADLLRAPCEQAQGLHVRGKFDLKLRNQPYSGICRACSEICGAIAALSFTDSEKARCVVQSIKDQLGSELRLLTQIIPALDEIVDQEDIPETKEELPGLSAASSESTRNQFNFAILRFMRTISSLFSTLTIVLDDLQWADTPSLNLLEVLLTDHKNSKLLVICLYRSNEVDPRHIFYQTLQDLKAHAKEHAFGMVTFDIGNLQLQAIHSIVQEVLGIDEDSRTLPLANLCFRKTQGNAFFLLHFMEMLHEVELIKFNFASFSWSWNIEEIESSTSFSDNVIDLLKTKMNDLDEDLQLLLKIAACLGSSFELRALKLVWEEKIKENSRDTEESKNQDLVLLLDLLVSSGFIAKLRGAISKSYCWEHDKIQEAALAMLPQEQRTLFGRKIGEILVHQLSEKDLDSPAIFVVANLLNGSSKDLDAEEKLKLVRLNDQACRKAIASAAFEPAVEYARRGIELLPANCWESHYHLALSLYGNGAKAEGYAGNSENMERLCQMVLSKEGVPMEDKIDVYNTWIDSLMNHGYMKEGADLLLELLSKFRISFSKNKVGILCGVLSNIVRLKTTMTTRDVKNLKQTKDPSLVERMKLLDKLTTCMYQLSDDRMPLVIFRSLNISIDQGISAYSPVAFVTTAVIVTGVLNDLQGGSKYAEKALKLLEISKTMSTKSRTIMCVYSFAFPWTQPIRSMMKPLLEAYNVGLQTGDTESACFSSYSWLYMRLMVGGDLDALESDCSLYGKQMRDLHRDQAYFPTLLIQQACLNLIGRDNQDDGSSIIGTAFSEDDHKHFSGHTSYSFMARGMQAILLTFFGRHVECAKLILRYGYDEFEKAHVAFYGHTWMLFLRGISCFAAAQQTRKRKYLKIANVIRKKFKGWLKMGNPNIQHYIYFLDAEAMAYHGNVDDAIRNYEVAVIRAVRAGHLHDAALASERLSQFQMDRLKDLEEATYRFNEAIKYYKRWGAIGKARSLKISDDEAYTRPREVFSISSISELTAGG